MQISREAGCELGEPEGLVEHRCDPAPVAVPRRAFVRRPEGDLAVDDDLTLVALGHMQLDRRRHRVAPATDRLERDEVARERTGLAVLPRPRALGKGVMAVAKGRGRVGGPAELLRRWPHHGEPRDDPPHLLGQPVGGVARLVVHGALSTDRAAQSLNSGARFSLRAATASSKLRVVSRTNSCAMPSWSMCDWRLPASRLADSIRLVSSTPGRLKPRMRSAMA